MRNLIEGKKCSFHVLNAKKNCEENFKAKLAINGWEINWKLCNISRDTLKHLKIVLNVHSMCEKKLHVDTIERDNF